MGRKNADNMVNWEQANRLSPSDRNKERMRIFMEMMQDIYGPDVEDRMSFAKLIELHREVAEKLMLGKRKPKEEDFFSPRAKKAKEN